MRFSVTKSTLTNKEYDLEEIHKSQIHNNYYSDRNLDNNRIQKACIPSFTIGKNPLELFIADYKWDRKTFESITINDSLDYTIDSLVTVKINDVEITSKWYYTNHPQTGQRGWLAYLLLPDSLKEENILTIDKWLWDASNEEKFFQSEYCYIPFWKN